MKSPESPLCGSSTFRLLGITLLILLAACDQLPASSYEECLLRNLRAASSDLAVAQITSACHSKHPLLPPLPRSIREFGQPEYARLTGRADQNPSTAKFSGTLYNGNSNLVVTQFKVVLHTKVGENELARTYLVDAGIRPLAAGRFTIDVVSGDVGTDFKWQVIGASGFEQ